MKADKVIGLILVAFSIFMYIQADRLPPALFGTLGAGFVPKILFIILAGCGAILTIQCLIRERIFGDASPVLCADRWMNQLV